MIELLESAKRFVIRGRSIEHYQAMQAALARRMVAQLQRTGLNLRQMRVLEVAAGAGGYSTTLYSACGELVASDMNESAFLETSPVPFERFDVMEGPSRTGYFDLVICASLIEHVGNPALALAHLHEALKEGGKLYLTFPPFYSLWMLGGHRFKPFHLLGERLAVRIHNWRHPQAKVRDYRTCEGNFGLTPLTIGRVQQLLAESGFRIITQFDRHLSLNPTRWPGPLKDLFTIHYCCLAEKAHDLRP